MPFIWYIHFYVIDNMIDNYNIDNDYWYQYFLCNSNNTTIVLALNTFDAIDNTTDSFNIDNNKCSSFILLK